MPDLSDLIARVEAASGPDRELDADIAEHVYGWKRATIGPDYDGENSCEILTPDGKLIPGFAYPNRGVIHRSYHCENYTRDCRDPAFPRDAVRKQLAANLSAILKARQTSNGDRHAGEKGE
jgi:hypothetical protein